MLKITVKSWRNLNNADDDQTCNKGLSDIWCSVCITLSAVEAMLIETRFMIACTYRKLVTTKHNQLRTKAVRWKLGTPALQLPAAAVLRAFRCVVWIFEFLEALVSFFSFAFVLDIAHFPAGYGLPIMSMASMHGGSDDVPVEQCCGKQESAIMQTDPWTGCPVSENEKAVRRVFCICLQPDFCKCYCYCYYCLNLLWKTFV